MSKVKYLMIIGKWDNLIVTSRGEFNGYGLRGDTLIVQVREIF